MGWSHRLVLTGIGSGYLGSLIGSWRAFAGAAKRPWKTQADLLDGWIARHRDTAYGKMHGVDRIDTIEAFQSRLPIIDYEALRPFIDRIAKGEANVLSPLPVRALEPSSGTTGGNKLIPYDDLFLDEFSRATAPWLFTTYASRPRLIGTSSYWSVSPAAREKKKSEGGIPIGFSDDTEYFGPMERWALRRMMAVPGTVAGIEEIEEWRFVTAQHLLSDRDLGFISVWNPSFLTLLMEAIEERFGELVDTLPEKGRARELRRVSSLDGRALWPRLRLISCWTDGHAQRFVAPMARRFPGVEIAGKGLLATEGVISFPLGGGYVAAIRSHFFEFQDLAHLGRRPLLIDQLAIGGRYAPIITTGNGFCRYRLPDEIECTGFFERTPQLRFVGKLDRISDLCGEKVTAAEVDRAIERAARKAGGFEFALVAPSEGLPPRYRLYLEGGSPSPAASEVEAALCENHHYKYCRDLGQLGPVEAVVVRDGWRIYERVMIEQGMKAGDVKPTHLDTRTIWSEIFAAAQRHA